MKKIIALFFVCIAILVGCSNEPQVTQLSTSDFSYEKDFAQSCVNANSISFNTLTTQGTVTFPEEFKIMHVSVQDDDTWVTVLLDTKKYLYHFRHTGCNNATESVIALP